MQNSWTRDDCERSGPSVETPLVSSPEEDDSSKEATAPYETPSLALAFNAAYKRQPVRQRTAQACDKCRERKTKCSGHRPVCNRCTNRGLNCEYSVRELRTTTRPLCRKTREKHTNANMVLICVDLTVSFSSTIPATERAYRSKRLCRLDQYLTH